MLSSKTLAQSLTKMSSEKQVQGFFNFLEKKKLMNLLPQIKKHLVVINQEQQAFNTLHISSKYLLSDSEVNQIKKVVNADESTHVVTHTDESIIGSYKAEFQGKMYDGSLETKVQKLQKALTQ